MIGLPKQLADLLDPRRTDQRGALRHGIQGVTCSAGRILDLSITGMQLQAKREWPAGESRTLSFTARPTELSLTAASVWSRREGWRKHIVGVAFESLSAEQRATLLRLVESHAVRNPLNPLKLAN